RARDPRGELPCFRPGQLRHERAHGLACADELGRRAHLANGQYSYVWKTSRSLAGTCRELRVLLVDGTLHTRCSASRKAASRAGDAALRPRLASRYPRRMAVDEANVAQTHE